MKPVISIIIPVYNVEKFLPQCLDSIICQTYKDFEVIMVDDGSPDGSGIICDAYAEKDNRFLVIHKQNAGVSAARNTGIEVARGEWISFIDSDDFVEPDYLEAFHLKDNDADLIIQGLEYYNHRTNQYFGEKRLKKIRLTVDNIKQETEACELLEVGFPYGKAYWRKSLIDNNIRFDTSISFHEDHIFVLDYLNVAQHIVLSDCISYKYRCYHTAQSLSSKRHSWQNLFRSADGMIASLNRLHDRFLNSGSAAERSAYHFAYSPKLSAVNELFRTSDDYAATKVSYFTIINKEELRKLYHPQDRKGKLYRNIMLHLPFCGVYLFFKTLVKYQNRNK